MHKLLAFSPQTPFDIQDLGRESINAMKRINTLYDTLFFERKPYFLLKTKFQDYTQIRTFSGGTLGPDFTKTALFEFTLNPDLSASEAIHRLFSSDDSFPRVIDCEMATILARYHALLTCIGNVAFDRLYGSKTADGSLGRLSIKRPRSEEDRKKLLCCNQTFPLDENQMYPKWNTYPTTYFKGHKDYDRAFKGTHFPDDSGVWVIADHTQTPPLFYGFGLPVEGTTLETLVKDFDTHYQRGPFIPMQRKYNPLSLLHPSPSTERFSSHTLTWNPGAFKEWNIPHFKQLQ